MRCQEGAPQNDKHWGLLSSALMLAIALLSCTPMALFEKVEIEPIASTAMEALCFVSSVETQLLL